MGRTTNLRRQHDTAMEIVAGIQTEMAAAAPLDIDRARRVSLLIAKLTGLLRIHFIQEDKALYPSLMASDNGNVALVARRFFAEMGTLGPVYHQFAEKWSGPDAILAAWDEFKRESDAVFNALGDRIKRENSELYPLADSLDQSGASRAA